MREKPDHYTNRAKREGYPARSVYKLEEIHQKNKLFKHGDAVLDVGASPGSWTLYTLKAVTGQGSVCAVDLKPLNLGKKYPNLSFFQGDAFAEENLAQIRSHGPYNTVISDAAPATTGNRTIDAGQSYSLVEEVILLADEVLIPGGNLVVKIFQGGDEQELLQMIRERYKTAKALKPKACRRESFETYFIGLGFKGKPDESK